MIATALINTSTKKKENHPVDRPVLLFLHGMFSQESDWEVCTRHFQKNWEVLVPKLPIFDLPKEETGVEGLYHQVVKLLDDQGIQNVVIGGNSLGGHIGLLMAIHHPERVSRLILAGSSGLFERGFKRAFHAIPRKSGFEKKLKKCSSTPDM